MFGAQEAFVTPEIRQTHASRLINDACAPQASTMRRLVRRLNGAVGVALLAGLLVAVSACSSDEQPADEDSAATAKSDAPQNGEAAPPTVLAEPRPAVKATWSSDVKGTWPTRRIAHATELDRSTNEIILFGGLGGNNRPRPLAESHIWDHDEQSWRLASGNLTAPRWNTATAWDSTNERIVMFGGRGGIVTNATIDNETLVWDRDNEEWVTIGTGGPSPRDASAMCWDEANGHVVLFGGRSPDQVVYNDTWIFTGNDWQLVATDGPPARFDHRMVFDQRLGRPVIFGGHLRDGTRLNDLWAWNGQAWEEIKPAEGTAIPPARSLHAMAWDPVNQRIIVSGGWDQFREMFNDLWSWDGHSWQELDAGDMFARYSHTICWSPQARGFVIFGGRGEEGFFADSWLLTIEADGE